MPGALGGDSGGGKCRSARARICGNTMERSRGGGVSLERNRGAWQDVQCYEA